MLVTFLDRLHVREGSRPGRWVLIQPFGCQIDDRLVTVPADFETDLDSVPRIPVAYTVLKGRATRSAVLHDWL